MIVLKTTDNLLISATAGVPVVSSWRDRNTNTFVAGKSAFLATGSSDLIFVTGPCGSDQRMVDFISIYNPTTGSITVQIKSGSGSTTAVIYNGTIGPYSGVQYAEKTGFYGLDSGGSKISIIENSGYPVPSPYSNVFLSDQFTTTATGTFFDSVTGLAFFGETGGTYYFCWRFAIQSTSSSASFLGSVTGPGPQSPPFLGFLSEVTLSSNSYGSAVYGATYGAPGSFLGTYNSSGQTGANFMRIEGIIKLDSSTSGNIIPQVVLRSAAGNAITILPGSYLEYHKFA